MRLYSFGVCILVLSATFAGAEEGVSPLTEDFVKAFRANDLEGVVATYAPNAVFYPPGAMEAIGTDAIRESWGGLFAAFTVKELNILEAAHEIHGDVAHGWGKFVMKLIPKGGGDPVTMEGRFTDISKRIGGKWLYIMDHASLPLPPAPEPATPVSE